MIRHNISLTRPIRKINATIAAAFFVSLLGACGSSAENAMEASAVAQQYFDERNFYEARKSITEAIALRDDIPGLHILKGRIELASGRPRDAFLAYSDALSLEAANPEALQAVSQLGLQTGYLQDAERAADAMLSFSPELPEAMLTKGLIALVRRKHEEALGFAERILAARPGDEAGTILKARTMALTGDPVDAIAMLQKTSADKKYTQGVDMTLIELYRETSNLPEMKATFERLLVHRPDDMALRIDYANTLYKSGDIAQARAIIEEMLRNNLDEKRPLTMMTGLWLEYDQQPLNESLVDFLSQEGSLESRVAIARYLLAVDRPEQARRILRSVSSGFWPEPRALFARTLEKLGEADEAYDMAAVLLENDETNADALLVRVKQSLEKQDFAQAINDAQIIIRDNPKFVPGYLSLADVYIAKNDRNGAKRVFADAIKLIPQDPILFGAYSRFLIENGDRGRAIAATRTYARDTPASIRAWRLYGETCEKAGLDSCKLDALKGEQIAGVIFAIDLPPGSPPTRGLFGRLQ